MLLTLTFMGNINLGSLGIHYTPFRRLIDKAKTEKIGFKIVHNGFKESLINPLSN